MIRKINGKNCRIPSGNQQVLVQLSTTNPIYLDYVYVGANTIKVGDTIFLRSLLSSFSPSIEPEYATDTIRLYWNTSFDVNAATQLASFTLDVNTTGFSFSRRIHFPSISTGKIINTAFNTGNDSGDFTTTISTPSITNWLSSNGYFFLTADANLGSQIGDSVSIYYITIEI